MKRILIINGHPNPKSLCSALAQSYTSGAKAGGFEAKLLNLSELTFDPILHRGYQEIQELEPDLIKAQQDILWAEHLVVVYPMWWGSVPALFKGFLDRTFLPGFAFKYHKNDPFWDKLLKGRTGRILMTTDAPNWWNWLMYRNPQITMMKKTVLGFTGVKPVRVKQFDSIKARKPEALKKFLDEAEALGRRGF